MLSGTSFMKMGNRTGPRTDPWCTPDSSGTGSEAWPSKTTCWVRPESHELIHLWVDPLIPYYSNLCNSLLCGTLSKALAKSIMIKSVRLCLQFTAPSRLLMMSCTNWTNWVLQDLWLRKPCWQSASMLSKAKCLLMLLTKICSRNQNKRQTNGLFALIFNETFSLCIKLHIYWNTDDVIVVITKN